MPYTKIASKPGVQLRLPALVLLTLLAALWLASPSTARAEDWCFDDPIVEIGGHVVSIKTGVQGSAAEVERHVDEARVRIIVPHGVNTRLIASTRNHFDERTRFKKARKEIVPEGRAPRHGEPIQVRVEVTFKATKDFPAVVIVESPAGVYSAAGSTRGQITVALRLP